MIAVVTLMLGLSLLTATVLIHYETLRMTGRIMPRLRIRPRQRILVVIAACLAAHLVEIMLYAAVLAALHVNPVFGTIEGEFTSSAVDYVYFSLTSYTTLGIGEVYPTGPLRLIVGIEALNGFLLITWSASFAYLNMQRDWHPETDA